MTALQQYTLYRDFIKGLWRESPTFRQILGMCPTLAVTNSAINGLAMGLATLFVVTAASTTVSLFRRVIPNQVRIATFTVIIATYVTMADLFLAAKFPPISKALGPYVPLIVVNCLIMGRAEAFASKHPVARSLADALGMGLGFTWALVVLGSIRELLGSRAIFTLPILSEGFRPWVIMILPAGAFITLGIMIGIINVISEERVQARVRRGLARVRGFAVSPSPEAASGRTAPS